jgi:hypothetical protein
MFRATASVFAAALAVSAGADVQFFFTYDVQPWAGAGPANIFAPTAGNQSDYTLGGYRPDFTHFPTAMVDNLTVQPGQTAYIWIKATPEHQVPTPGAKLQGMHWELQNEANEPFTPGLQGEVTYYILDDGTGGTKRWDGAYTPPGYEEFRRNPQWLVAVTANGIRNLGADRPENLWQGSTRTALLGAIRIFAPGVYHWYFIPDLYSTGFHWGGYPWDPPTPTQLGTLTVVPEPAAGLLVAAVVAVYRRRN